MFTDLPVILHWCDLAARGFPECALFKDPCPLCDTLSRWVRAATKTLLHNLFVYYYHAYAAGSDMALLHCGVFTAEGASRYLRVSRFDPENPPGDVRVVRAFLKRYFGEADETMLGEEMWPYAVMAANNKDVCVLSQLHVDLVCGEKVKRSTHVQLLSHVVLAAHMNGALRFNACLATEMYSGAIPHALVNVLLHFHREQKAIAKIAKELS